MPAEFVDTNIVVYAYDRTAGSKFDRSRELMEKLWDTGEGVVSTQVLEEFYVTVTAKFLIVLNLLRPRSSSVRQPTSIPFGTPDPEFIPLVIFPRGTRKNPR